ncbi:hypothetical protein BIW11_07333, partial [Tropilaelaps mercedesae]
MSLDQSVTLFCEKEGKSGAVPGTPTAPIMSNAHNGPSTVFGPGVGSSVGSEDTPEIDEMLSAVSTTTLELPELESLVLDDNQQLFGQEVTLTTDILSPSDQSVQLDHCYAQSPSADPSPVSDAPRTLKPSKRGAKRNAENDEGAPAKQANKQGVGKLQQWSQQQQQRQSSANTSLQRVVQPVNRQQSQSCVSQTTEMQAVIRKGKNPVSSQMAADSMAISAIIPRDEIKE